MTDRTASQLADLPTPAALIDRTRLVANCARMLDKARAHKVQLRPHVKTAKCVEVALLALGGSPGPITVSTLAEARFFAQTGFKDILYAVSIVPIKITPLAAIMRASGADITCVTDCLDPAFLAALNGAAQSQNITLNLLIEVDSGDARAGLASSAQAVELGRAITTQSHLHLAGVMTHAGQSYGAKGHDQIKVLAEFERKTVVAAAQALRAAGLDVEIVSLGSTPTAVHAEDLTGVTEMRPGVYVFNDMDQAGIGSCGAGDLALSVLASVIGHRPDKGHLLIDAGGLALSKDLSANRKGDDSPPAYGRVVDIGGAALPGSPVVFAVSQEHGRVRAGDGGPPDFAAFPVGAKLRILPNHACYTAAAYDRYHVISNEKLEVWPRVNGWY